MIRGERRLYIPGIYPTSGSVLPKDVAMAASCSCSPPLPPATSSALDEDLPGAPKKPADRVPTAMRQSRNKMRQRHPGDAIGNKEDIGLDQLDGNPDSATYAMLLRRCGRAKALLEGKRVQAHIFKTGHGNVTMLKNLLVQMYGQCGSLEDARRMFYKIREPNIYSWNIMLAAYARNGHAKEALELFESMELKGLKPDKVTFVTALNACSSLGALREGKRIHARVIVGGLESNVVLATALVNMYGKCGSMDDARMAFEKIVIKDAISWNTIIAAYAQNGHGKQALDLYRKMLLSSVKPDAATFVAALDACATLKSVGEGKLIHAHIVSHRLEWNVMVATALVSMYSKCGCLEEARSVFNSMEVRNVVSWTAMIAANAQNGHSKEALELYQRMRMEGLKLDNVTFGIALGACSRLKALAEGKAIHAHIEASGLEADAFVATSLVDMYVTCGSLEDAREIVIRQRNVVFWNALIVAYSQSGHGREALKLYGEMGAKGVRPDRDTFTSVLDTCGCLGALAEGRVIHTHIVAKAFDSNVLVQTALVNMYSICGSLGDARAMFNEMRRNNVVFWTAMIAAYARHGHSKEVFELFQQMCQQGLKPNKITFLSVLYACGSLQEGWWHFNSMLQDHDIRPIADHYRSIIDLLSRSGKLREAHELINSMPFQPDGTAWMSLLNGCKIHGNEELGMHAAEHVFEHYVALAKIYAEAGKWDEIAKLRKVLQDRGLSKNQSPPSQEEDKMPVLRSPIYMLRPQKH